MMNFSEALSKIKEGEKVSRKGWNGAGQYVFMVKPDEDKNISAFIGIKPVEGPIVPWLASQTDLLREDWFVVKPNENSNTPKTSIDGGSEPGKAEGSGKLEQPVIE